MIHINILSSFTRSHEQHLVGTLIHSMRIRPIIRPLINYLVPTWSVISSNLRNYMQSIRWFILNIPAGAHDHGNIRLIGL